MFNCFNVLKILDITEQEFDEICLAITVKGRNVRAQGTNIILFDSDWVPPTSLINTLSKKLHRSTFIISGNIMDIQSICKATYKNGEILEIEELKYEL